MVISPKSLLHVGFALAISVLLLKAIYREPKLRVSLRAGETAELGGDILVLKDFAVPKYPSGKPRQYVSDVHVLSSSSSGGAPSAAHAKISVNHPLRWKGWWIYQNSYDGANEEYTVLEAIRDPYLPIAALAGILLILGAAGLCLRGKRGQVTAATHFARWRFVAVLSLTLLTLWISGRAVLANELMPALQSPLLIPHVGAYVISYVILFAAAFGIAKRAVPFGFLMMTLALVLGATWGKICWGDWWQYDPKEMWSLFTWLTYAAYFHFRDRPAGNWLLRFGAVMILLTLTWANYSRIFNGLHSYA